MRRSRKKMLYPRDPSLDPQLVWKGKDEQDREPLEVDIVPIYIQEVIEPRVIIEAVQAAKDDQARQQRLLARLLRRLRRDGIRPTRSSFTSTIRSGRIA